VPEPVPSPTSAGPEAAARPRDRNRAALVVRTGNFTAPMTTALPMVPPKPLSKALVALDRIDVHEELTW
jgi:hypothetical protein